MKKLIVFGSMAALMCSLAACGGKTESNPEADSLRTVLSAKIEEMDEMNLFLDAVNVSMDSVMGMEGNLLRTTEDSPLSKKDQIKHNIEAYQQILQQQRERLNVLEKKLKNSNAYAGKMEQTIATLKQQLEEKDQLIAKLTEEVNQRNFDIEGLKENITELSSQVTALETETKAKAEEITSKTNEMNEAYVIIASKKALKEKGLVEGGSLFSKLKVVTANIDKSQFKKIDIRNTKSFNIPDDDPDVLSQMPAGSYRITENGDDSSTLTITDPARFWSVTRYLIIKY